MNTWMLSFSEDNRTMAFLSRVSKCARGKTSETKSQKCHENNSKSDLVCKTIHSFALNWFIIIYNLDALLKNKVSRKK